MTTSKSKRTNDLNLDAYEALNFEGLGRHANYRIVAYREDMLHVLDKKDAAAIIYHILYRWLTEKRRDDILAEMEAKQKASQALLTPEEVENRMWIYMSYNEFVRESGGAISYNTVIRTLDYLLEKGVIERRKNSNPKFTEYEYRINKKKTRELLKELPTFPYYLAKGAKGSDVPATPTQIGTGTPYPSRGGTPTHFGVGDTHFGVGDTHLGATPYPSGGTSQKKTQNPPQDSSHEIPQQQKRARSSTLQQPATAAHPEFGNLSEEEIAIILELRRQQATETAPPLSENAPSSEQAEIVTQENAQQAEDSPLTTPRPASDAQLSDEVIVELFEQKHSACYDDDERPFQLQAARSLLALRLVLTVDLLERVYDECYDKWWRDHYGDLHVSHLVEKEKNHGQRRIVRLLKRVQSRDQAANMNADADTSLASGAAANEAVAAQERMVMWNGHLMPEKQAYQEGYMGGWERFKPGDHPDDDLEAVVKRLQAEGRLPVLEEAQVSNE